MQRKRVGFTDPVSTTKEYIVNEEEVWDHNNSSSARCLIYDDPETVENVGIKSEPELEIIEIGSEEFLESQVGTTTSIGSEIDQGEDETEARQAEDRASPEPSLTPTDSNLIFKNKNELLNYIKYNLSVDEVLDNLAQKEDPEPFKRKEILKKVVEKVSFREMFEEYLYGGIKVEDDKSVKLTHEQSTLVTSIANEISKVMANNIAVKYKVLDILSERHSNEFLDHALQENSSNVVCEKLSIKSIVNFLIYKTNVHDSNENSDLINNLSKEMILHLVSNLNNFGTIANNTEISNILLLLFKNRAKVEVFDLLHEFLRNML